MIENLRGRSAVVTGAGSGIGRATALRLSEAGCTLSLLDVDEGGLAATAGLLQTPSTSHVVDVSDAARVADSVDAIVAAHGYPNVLVNSAGIMGPRTERIWESTVDSWQHVFSVNVFGTANCVRSFIPALEAARGPSHIAILSSAAGLWAPKQAGIYGASKHALVSFGESLHHELAASNSSIGVSLVCPRGVRTPFNGSTERDVTASAGLIGPEVVAQHIVDALHDDRLYVFTHESTRQAFDAYHDRVMQDFDDSVLL